MKLRACNWCLISKPFPEAYNRRVNYNKTKTRLYKGHCKACDVEAIKRWRLANHDRYLKYQYTYHTNKRKKQLALGLCIQCNKKHVPEQSYCKGHLEKVRKLWRRANEKRKNK